MYSSVDRLMISNLLTMLQTHVNQTVGILQVSRAGEAMSI
jgi:hypothetical protein